MKKKRWLISVFLFVLITGISLYFDTGFSKLISLLRTRFLDNIFLGITFVSSEIIIFFILTSLFLWKDNKRKWIVPLWFSLAASAIVSFFLKIAVQRNRPFQLGLVPALTVLQEASFNIWNFSFPSFQTMMAFSAVPILSREYPRLKYFWIAFAGLIGFSRIYFGLHFLSDVVIGGFLGYLIGMFIVQKEEEIKFGEKIARMVFKKKVKYKYKEREK
ncbi:MAG: phosphatase PAP2 family protein [Nanoarchaeota archaeon]|nr:phosphatase PAP2 family protein [Nanoarchaeota archaeon]